MRLQDETEHPHGLNSPDYDALFTRDKPIIFAFHGYPWLIHRLTYRRANQKLHVRGYKEEGTYNRYTREGNEAKKYTESFTILQEHGDTLEQAMKGE
jgi:phosphoketolase